MNRKYQLNRIAVIGLGNIASRHRANLKMLFPDSLLYAMSSSGRQQNSVPQNADALVYSISELVDNKVELVIVASPAPFHARDSLPLIKAGIPVLIEKPVSSSLLDARSLEIAELKYRTPVAIGYCLRYLPSTLEIKRILASKKIGKLYNVNIEIGQYLPDWRPSKDYRESVSASAALGGGALLELSHELDYARWLLGPLDLQHAILRKSEELSLEVEDSADIFLTTKNNAVVYVHLDFLQRRAQRKCRFVGSAGALEWDLINNEIYYLSSTETTMLYSEPGWDKNKMYLAMLEDFIAKINGEKNQCITLCEARETVELIEQIRLGSSKINMIDSVEC